MPVTGSNVEPPPRLVATEPSAVLTCPPLTASEDAVVSAPAATLERPTGVALPTPVPTSVIVFDGVSPFGVTEPAAVVYCTGAPDCSAAMAKPTSDLATPPTVYVGAVTVPSAATAAPPPRAAARPVPCFWAAVSRALRPSITLDCVPPASDVL